MMDNLRLAHPWILLALLLLPLLWYLWSRPRWRPVLRFSSLAELRVADSGVMRRGRLILPILRTIALACLIVAVTRPQQADESTRVFAEGIAIQMVVDTSGSMSDLDLSPPDRKMTRLDVVKDVFRRFVQGDEAAGLGGRPDDLIGLVRFAHYPDAVSPLTLDHEALLDVLESLGFAGVELLRGAERLLEHAREEGQRGNFAEQRRLLNVAARLQRDASQEDGTAIGDGLALAVERLKDLRRTTGSGDQITITSRVIILLTDGENNAGTISPRQAGELAARYGIKVYTILAGTGQLVRFGFRLPVDDGDLRYIAEVAGGKHYRARDEASLARIYAKIDELERTKVEEKRYTHWGELSHWWLVVAFAALSLQTFLDATRLRKIP